MPLIEPGRKAPAFSLKDQTGKTHKLADYDGAPLVLYFYPKDDTPGCTQETCEFRDLMPRFGKTKAAVLGVSILDEKSKAKFANKYNVTFPLLADADHAVAEKYGCWGLKKFMGREFMGILRTTFIIGADGKLKHIIGKVNTKTHHDDVLAWIKTNL